MVDLTKINIDGVDYEMSKLPIDLQNIIIARQEIQVSKTRHNIELEKIEVLTNYYNNRIKEGLDKFNGSDSTSNDWTRRHI